jgi:hypothetical protein
MIKTIGLSLVISSFASIAGNALSSEIQPYPDYLAAYGKTLFTTGCEQTLKGGSGRSNQTGNARDEGRYSELLHSTQCYRFGGGVARDSKKAVN